MPIGTPCLPYDRETPHYMSLRDELMATPRAMPDYQLVLPPGWSEYTPDEMTESLLLKQAEVPLRESHRPDLAAELRRMTRQSFSAMRRSETIAFYMQAPRADDIVFPVTITVTKRVAPNGATFDAQVTDLIRNHDAKALNDDKLMIRWETESTHDLGGEKVASRTISYLTPVPGSGRREALLFAAVIPHPIGMESGDGSLLEQFMFMADVIMSTFAWTRPAGETK